MGRINDWAKKSRQCNRLTKEGNTERGGGEKGKKKKRKACVKARKQDKRGNRKGESETKKKKKGNAEQLATFNGGKKLGNARKKTLATRGTRTVLGESRGHTWGEPSREKN